MNLFKYLRIGKKFKLKYSLVDTNKEYEKVPPFKYYFDGYNIIGNAISNGEPFSIDDDVNIIEIVK